MTKLIPLGNKIVIRKPEKPEAVSEAGILLSSESTPEPENIGIVLAVGERVDNVSVGDTVVFNTYGFTEIEDEGVDYYIIDVPDLLAKKK